MSAAEVFKRMLRDEVAAALRATGLRGSGATYLMRSASHWALLGFQGSTANSAERMKFTVNCTVVRKDTWAAAYAGAAVHRREAEAEVRAGVGWCARLGAWMPDGQDLWWWLERDSDSRQIAEEVVAAIVQHALPAMRAEIAATT